MDQGLHKGFLHAAASYVFVESVSSVLGLIFLLSLYVHWPFLHRCYWSVHGCCTSSLNVGLHVFCSSSVSCERMSSEHVAIYKLCVICFRLRLSTFSSWLALICKLVTGFFTGLFLRLKVACLKLMWPQTIFLTVNVAMGKFCLRAACLNTVNSKYQI